MRIKNTIKPVQVNKANARLCDNFNKAKLFCDLYKNPSEWKQQIYARICSGASQRDHSSIHCVGNPFVFLCTMCTKNMTSITLNVWHQVR